LDCSHDFGPFGNRIWINCAHQGPLPRRAADEAREAIAWKVAPHELTQERFLEVPVRLRLALARLIGAAAEEIVLGNSASYGLHLLANGYPWRPGDEVLLVRGDFPSDILPWLALERQGVEVRTIEPALHLPTPDELSANITPRTRLFCSSWVHSFSGVTADISALGKTCQSSGITFVVNASQALGARTLRVSDVAVDAITGAGFKWLCGPYGTGFCWMKPALLRSLEFNQAYWLAEMTATDLGQAQLDLRQREGPPTARTFDVFGTANFFNFKPWAAALEYLLQQGIHRIADHDQRLVSFFIDGLNVDTYELLSPREGPARSTLILVSHRDPKRNEEVYELLKQQRIDIAYRRGKLRFAPHLYNTEADLAAALALLNSVDS
jgi:selenocysteine lyase/cysteine desulfurase